MTITINKTAGDIWSAASCSVTSPLKITVAPDLYAYNTYSAVSDSCTLGNLSWKVQCSVYYSEITLKLIVSGIDARTGIIMTPVQVKFSDQDQSHNTKASLSNGEVHLGTWPTMAFADPFLIIVTIPRKFVAMKMLMEFIQDSFLTGGDLVNIKFYAFTRLNDRTAEAPKPIYANSKFLLGWANEYLTNLLTSKIGESGIVELNTHSPPYLSYDKYDYESDSDMDPFEYRDESDEKDTGASLSNSEDQFEISAPQSRLCGRVIAITGTAFRTWKALIGYLYTGKITFAPLRSEFEEKSRPIDADACSPKSMYRLADECGFDDLKIMAFEQIKTRISAKNIVEEIYSPFTARYPEVQQFQIDYLAENIYVQDVKHDLLTNILSTRSATKRYMWSPLTVSCPNSRNSIVLGE